MNSSTYPIASESTFDAAPTGIERLLVALKARTRLILGLAIAFQIVVLGSMIAQKTIPLYFGKTVLLHVIPIDPRDMFRGDYVILGYDFSSAWNNSLPGLPKEYTEQRRELWNNAVYVVLKQEEDGKHWKAERFSLVRPTSGVFLKGVVAPYRGVTCGIESFYVQEGEGRRYEELVRDKKLSAEVAVGSNGEAVLKRLVEE